MIAQKLLWNFRIRNQKPAQYLLKTPYDILAEGGKITTLSQLLRVCDSNRLGLVLIKSTLFSSDLVRIPNGSCKIVYFHTKGIKVICILDKEI
jgi:hypothetical protein